MSPEDTLTGPDAWDHVTSYDCESQRPSEAVVTAVFETTGRDSLVGKPLYSVVDPDALDSLVRHGSGNELCLSFSYQGCLVRADEETIRVRQLDGAEHV